MKLLLKLALILLPFMGYSQAGTTINYVDGLGPLTLTYAGLVNGKHSYSTTVDDLTVAWSGTQWEITCCGGSLLFTSATMTAMNPPNLSIANWVDLLNNNLTVFDGTGTTTALPVKLISFSGDNRNGHNMLKWTTATEINNAGFEVQRSTDGSDFRKLGWIVGEGNSSRLLSYEFADWSILNNVEYYYRLKQVDIDGKFEYSDVVTTINRDVSKFMLHELFPNPTNGSIVTVDISSVAEGVLGIEVYDAVGKVVLQQSMSVTEGRNSLELDLNDIANGSYFVKVKSQNFTAYKKLVIAK